MNKVVKVLYKLFIVVFGILFTWVTLSIPFREVNTLVPIKSYIAVPFSIVLFLILAIVFYLLNKKEVIKFHKVLFALLIIIILLIESYMIKNLEVPMEWDFGFVIKAAREKVLHLIPLLQTDNPGYFQKYPNNIPLFCYFIVLFKICKAVGYLELIKIAVHMNALVIFLSIIFTYLYTKKVFNKSSGIFALILLILYIPLYLYIPVVYTDTMTIVFIPLLLYLSTFIRDKNKIIRIGSIIIFGLLAFAGAKIKLTVIFVPLSIIFAQLLKKRYKEMGYLILSLGISFITLGSIYNYYVFDKDVLKIKYDDWGSIPYSHWIMMGIESDKLDYPYRNSYGGYKGEDYIYTESFKNSKEAAKANIDEIIRRIKAMGPINYIDFLNKKTVNAWGDGNFFAATKLTFSSKYNMNEKGLKLSGMDREHKMIYFNNVVQYLFMLCLVFQFMRGIIGKKCNLECLLSVSMLLLFLMLWENRSRYLYNFIPIFVIIITSTYNDLRSIYYGTQKGK